MTEIKEIAEYEKKLDPVVSRIMAEYNLETREAIERAIKQATWEGICIGKGWE